MRKFVLILFAVFSMTSCYKVYTVEKQSLEYGYFSDEWVMEQDRTHIKSVVSSCVIYRDSVTIDCIKKLMNISYNTLLFDNIEHPKYEIDTILISSLKTTGSHFFHMLEMIDGKDYYSLGNEVYITDKMYNEIIDKYGKIQN